MPASIDGAALAHKNLVRSTARLRRHMLDEIANRSASIQNSHPNSTAQTLAAIIARQTEIARTALQTGIARSHQLTHASIAAGESPTPPIAASLKQQPR